MCPAAAAAFGFRSAFYADQDDYNTPEEMTAYSVDIKLLS